MLKQFKVLVTVLLFAGAARAELAPDNALMAEMMRPPVWERLKPASTEELTALMDQSRIPKFKPLFVDALPPDFPEKGTPFLLKKTLTPIVLKENERISLERNILFELQKKFVAGSPWTKQEEDFFNFLLKKYDGSVRKDRTAQLEDLILKVNVIPPSLIIAQMGQRTNWGKENMTTPFGEYVWLDRETYSFKPYESLIDATRAFMLELNSSMPLFAFRSARSLHRHLNMPSGKSFTDFIAAYQPDDTGYVRRLNDIFNDDHMALFDISQLEAAPEKAPEKEKSETSKK